MKVGDTVKVVDGPYDGLVGTIIPAGRYQMSSELTVARDSDDKVFYFPKEALRVWSKPTAEETSKSFQFFETLLDSAEEAHELSKAFYNELIDCGLLHASKQRDYGKDDDPFANVRGSEALGIPGWIGAVLRNNDKQVRLQKACRDTLEHGKPQLAHEGVRDSLRDQAVYALIGLVLYDEWAAENGE